MKNKRRFLFTAGTVLVILAVAVLMFIIGRGHTVYFDNKTLEYEGQEYKAFHKVIVTVDGEQAAKLSARDRGMATTMGQTFSMSLDVTREKGGEVESYDITMALPYSMDGILVNLPGLLNGLGEEAFLSEFVIVPAEEEEVEAETDEFGIAVTEDIAAK